MTWRLLLANTDCIYFHHIARAAIFLYALISSNLFFRLVFCFLSDLCFQDLFSSIMLGQMIPTPLWLLIHFAKLQSKLCTCRDRVSDGSLTRSGKRSDCLFYWNWHIVTPSTRTCDYFLPHCFCHILVRTINSFASFPWLLLKANAFHE